MDRVGYFEIETYRGVKFMFQYLNLYPIGDN